VKPLRLHGLPLHPALVHFPVAAWTVATGLVLAGPLELARAVPDLAVYTNAFGLITGGLAMVAGLSETAGVPRHEALRDSVGRHLVLAVSAWLAFGVMLVLQIKGLPIAAMAVGVVAFSLLMLAGHAGARVVYHHGFPRQPEPP